MTRLLLVRHGQSTWNAQSRWQGQADPPLSELGTQQARSAADRLAIRCSIGSIWTSDLIRAQHTAALIAEQLDLDVRADGRLRERDAGEWTGLTRTEIEDRYPGDLRAHRSPPGFERDEPLLERVLEALAHIAPVEVDSGEVLVVTHGGVVRTIERRFGADAEPVPNLGGRWLVAEAGDLRLGDRELLIDPDEVAVTVPRSI